MDVPIKLSCETPPKINVLTPAATVPQFVMVMALGVLISVPRLKFDAAAVKRLAPVPSRVNPLIVVVWMLNPVDVMVELAATVTESWLTTLATKFIAADVAVPTLDKDAPVVTSMEMPLLVNALRKRLREVALAPAITFDALTVNEIVDMIFVLVNIKLSLVADTVVVAPLTWSDSDVRSVVEDRYIVRCCEESVAPPSTESVVEVTVSDVQ